MLDRLCWLNNLPSWKSWCGDYEEEVQQKGMMTWDAKDNDDEKTIKQLTSYGDPGIATILRASLVIGNFYDFCPFLAFDC